MAKGKVDIKTPFVNTVGFDKVFALLEAESLKGQKSATASVVFPAPYAIYVHENLEAHHSVGQAKFLEVAARRHAGEARQRFLDILRSKRSLDYAVAEAAEIIRYQAVQLAPIDTGFLRESAYVLAGE